MRVNGVPYRTVWIDGGIVKLIDQRLLPFRFEILSLHTYEETAEAIRNMTVRGAGAIGVTAGYAMAQAALSASEAEFGGAMNRAATVIRSTRPTARNLFYAVERVLDGIASAADISAKRAHAAEIAQGIADEDAAAGERIGEVGQPLFGRSTTVMTHCNAGWLAFADWGSALAPIYRAHREGKSVRVFATETRPRGQGAKLTAWELSQEGVPHTLIPDSAAAHLLRQGEINFIIVGADRIAANGDVANKIGTYALALAARAHRVPLYVAAPTTTIDMECPSGDRIPIEERSDEEVLWTTGMTADGRIERVRTAPEGTRASNWAFDVTPAALISGLITEQGLIKAEPAAIQHVMRAAAAARSA